MPSGCLPAKQLPCRIPFVEASLLLLWFSLVCGLRPNGQAFLAFPLRNGTECQTALQGHGLHVDLTADLPGSSTEANGSKKDTDYQNKSLIRVAFSCRLQEYQLFNRRFAQTAAAKACFSNDVAKSALWPLHGPRRLHNYGFSCAQVILN